MSEKAKKEHLATTPPPWNPEEFERDSESMIVGRPSPSMRPTAPPEATYNALRESCSENMLAALPSGDGPDWQSEVRVQSSAPLPRDIPSLDSVPYVSMLADDLAWFDLGPDAKLVLGLVDGCSPVGAILTTSPLGPDETCVYLRELMNVGVIKLR